MKVILTKIKPKAMGNLYMKMVNIIQDNGKMDQNMVEEQCFIQMEVLNMKVILLMVNMKEMEIYLGRWFILYRTI